MTETTLPRPAASESKQELGQFFTPLPVELLHDCVTSLFGNFVSATDVFFVSHECALDDLPSVSAWDHQQSRFLLVDLGEQVDVNYRRRRECADKALSSAGVPFVRIVALRNRQELVGRLDWIPLDTVVWIASEPKHHVDLGGNRLIGPRIAQ